MSIVCSVPQQVECPKSHPNLSVPCHESKLVAFFQFNSKFIMNPKTKVEYLMRHQDPICKRVLDDDTRYITFTESRVFYFCSEDCKKNFEASRALYLVKRIDQEQRKSYKSRSAFKPIY